jgi:hypothetical protein
MVICRGPGACAWSVPGIPVQQVSPAANHRVGCTRPSTSGPMRGRSGWEQYLQPSNSHAINPAMPGEVGFRFGNRGPSARHFRPSRLRIGQCSSALGVGKAAVAWRRGREEFDSPQSSGIRIGRAAADSPDRSSTPATVPNYCSACRIDMVTTIGPVHAGRGF